MTATGMAVDLQEESGEPRQKRTSGVLTNGVWKCLKWQDRGGPEQRVCPTFHSMTDGHVLLWGNHSLTWGHEGVMVSNALWGDIAGHPEEAVWATFWFATCLRELEEVGGVLALTQEPGVLIL